MSWQRCLQILTVCATLLLTGELVFARGGEYISDDSDGNAKVTQEEKPRQISRMELQEDLMRFAQMFIRRFKLEIYQLESQDASNAVRFGLSNAELNIVNGLLNIATGPDAVVNLLDMVILVTLGRMAVEKSWEPKVLGENKGRLPEFFRQMEKEIWAIAGKVLIPRYQKELRNLIRRWRKLHPYQFYIGGVGFDSFADMLKDSDFKDAGKRGFLLPEMNEATRSVDEVRNLAERFAFFIKYFPYITRTSTKTGIYDVLDQPETIQLLSDINRLTTAFESIGLTAKQLPDRLDHVLDKPETIQLLSDISRLTAAIDGIGLTAKQLPDRLSMEREKLMDDLLKSEKKIRALSGDIRKTLATGDKMAVSTNEAAVSINQAAISIDKLMKRIHARSKPGSFKIMEWFETFHEVSEAANQAQVLVAAVDKLLTDHGLEQRVPQLKKGFDAFLLRAFLWAALLIVFFFLALFVYRFLSQRFLIRRRKG
jgi:hypothetical protein